MILAKWINDFNSIMEQSSIDLSYLFHSFDEIHKGGFYFEEFCNMNDFIRMDFERKDMLKVFKCINKEPEVENKHPSIRIEQVRIILTMN